MIKGIDGILLSSENAKELANFYREKVGLPVPQEYEMGDEGQAVYQFNLDSGSDFAIMDHSEVKGLNDTPARYMLNFEVDDIDPEIERLKDENVEAVQDKYHIEGYGWVATFADPDGNYFQLVQVQPVNGKK